MEFEIKKQVVRQNIEVFVNEFKLHVTYDLCKDSEEEFGCFISGEKYIFECFINKNIIFAPYKHCMFSIGSIDTGEIDYWYDAEETTIKELLFQLNKMLNAIINKHI